MDHLSTILPKVLRKHGLEEHARAALVAHHARNWLRTELPRAAPFLRVVSLRTHTLTIAFRNSASGQACQEHMEELKTYLKRWCGQGTPDIQLVRERGPA